MNPNAHSFKPSISMNTAETVKYQMQFLLAQITASKKQLYQENHKLHALHDQMSREYQIISVETERSKRREVGCLKQKVILKMMADYKTRSAEYKKQHSMVMDITASVMTMKQKYTKLQMAAATAPPLKSLSAKKKKRSIFYGKESMRLLDGIEQRNKYQKPSSSLPSIEEAEGDILEWGYWLKDEHIDAEKGGDATSVASESSSISPQSIVYGIFLDEEHQKEGTPEPQFVEEDISNSNEPEETASSLSVPDKVNLNKFTAEIKYILRMVMYHRSEEIQTEMKQLLDGYGLRIMSVEGIQCLIGCIINDAVSSRPRLATLCARKYADLCSYVLHFCESTCCDTENENMKYVDAEVILQRQLYDTFYELQIGSDPLKFVNICILMGELCNHRQSLLRRSTIVMVFEDILGERNISKIGRNDIDGLHEIFKRCSVSLQKARYSQRRNIEYYLSVLETLKTRSSFRTKQNRKVPYMIDQIQRYFYCRR